MLCKMRLGAKGGRWHLVPLHLDALLLLGAHGAQRLDVLQRFPHRFAVLGQRASLIPNMENLRADTERT